MRCVVNFTKKEVGLFREDTGKNHLDVCGWCFEETKLKAKENKDTNYPLFKNSPANANWFLLEFS